VQHALTSLGFAGVDDVRQGKYIELDLTETDQTKARASVEQMCRTLLANMVIENYQVELIG
jgi:phosphoribosylformylglycinamidine synthase